MEVREVGGQELGVGKLAPKIALVRACMKGARPFWEARKQMLWKASAHDCIRGDYS